MPGAVSSAGVHSDSRPDLHQPSLHHLLPFALPRTGAGLQDAQDSALTHVSLTYCYSIKARAGNEPFRKFNFHSQEEGPYNI